MLVLESSRFNLNLDNNHEEEDRERKKKKSSSLLMMMVNKDGSSTMIVEDIEEGEISDESQSVEEISAEDFKQQEISSSTSAAAAATTTKEVAVSSKPLNSKSTSTSTSTSAREDSNSRVWMGDVYKYPVSSNYGGSGLYNFAWAQAVQNKPLSEGLMREFENNNNNNNNNNRDVENNGLNNNRSSSNTKSKDIVCDVIIEDSSSEEIDSNKVDDDDEELEEGEIELDSENCQRTPPHTTTSSSSSIDSKDNNKDEDDDLQERLKLIKQTLEIVTLNDAHKSFDGVCSRLQTSLDSFQVIVSKSAVSEELGALLDRTFAGIQALHSVYNSMNSKQQEQNKDNLSRLLARVKSQVPVLFSSEQMKKIQTAKDSLDSPSVSSSVKDMEVDEELRVNTGVKIELGILGEKHRLVNSSEKGLLEPISTKFGNQNNSVGSEILKQGVLSGNRGRMSFGPLLDLHRDHDVDSLPSPTREAPPPLNFRERQATDDGNVKSESIPKVANKSEETSLHSYETDAVKAVSSYQQKFSRTSFLLSSRLPSPTPSEESDGGGDCNGEVSSSSMIRNVTAVNPPMPLQFIGSVAPQMDKSTGQGPVLAKTMEQMASVPIPHTRASSKSRDPRLRLANLDAGPSDPKLHPLLRGTPKTEPVEGIITSRKNKNAEETLMDGQALKKQKLGLTNCEVSSDVQMARGSGWLENCSTARTPVGERIQSAESMGTDPRKLEIEAILSGQRHAISSGPFIAKTVGNDQLPVPVVGTSTTPSLSSLLKDIIVNPTMLVQLIMEQQRLAAEAQNSSSLLQSSTPAFTSNITPGTPLVNIGPSKSYDIQQKTEEKTPVLSETTSANPQSEWGKVRMKPRDPRRILHSSTIKKNESFGSEQFKMNGALQPSSQASTDNVSVRQQSEHAQTTTLPSQFSPPPDIARQFTKNLRNLADILSSQSTDSVSTVTHGGSSSQMIPVRAENADVGVSITDPKNHQSGTVMTPEGVTEASQSQNTWGDVEHLFEGYDDKQKAAIQRERARRIEEQNKMFAAKKLCLVLDLDHTLLNSAKFVEVEPVHEEILRKKEEQDREKPQRHLFRFYHMGMWTKLRPGIWTFLEKASKLYELHLYTMGNKLYATEMAKVLDPTGALFAGRVISKGDDGDPFDSDEKLPKSKDLEGVLGMESAVVIIDDSVKVWPHNKLNLILVERYTYFPCSRRQFGLPGPSLLEIDHDERPEDGTLASSLAVIERLHQNFFSNPSLHEVDIRNILASEQRKILSGCRIVFSRIFPVGEAKPHQHPLWQTAEQFGAVCTTQIDNLVTHVVANSLGTDKVNWALSTGRFVVHPGWVEASALLYRRASEQDFAVKINLP